MEEAENDIVEMDELLRKKIKDDSVKAAIYSQTQCVRLPGTAATKTSKKTKKGLTFAIFFIIFTVSYIFIDSKSLLLFNLITGRAKLARPGVIPPQLKRIAEEPAEETTDVDVPEK